MAEVRLDRVDFCKIPAHGCCFRAVSKGTSVDPARAWHLQWDDTGGGNWHIVLPNEQVHDVPMRARYAEWPPIALLDVDATEVGIDLRSVVTHIGDYLWPRGKPNPFLTR